LEIDVAKVSGKKTNKKKSNSCKKLNPVILKKLTPLFLRLQQIIQVQEMYQTVLVPLRST